LCQAPVGDRLRDQPFELLGIDLRGAPPVRPALFAGEDRCEVGACGFTQSTPLLCSALLASTSNIFARCSSQAFSDSLDEAADCSRNFCARIRCSCFVPCICCILVVRFNDDALDGAVDIHAIRHQRGGAFHLRLREVRRKLVPGEPVLDLLHIGSVAFSGIGRGCFSLDIRDALGIDLRVLPAAGEIFGDQVEQVGRRRRQRIAFRRFLQIPAFDRELARFVEIQTVAADQA
jgi:hypothetical protein